ncbi:MAG: DUF998 domain-containing protein [Chloroflexi bacterium]|nr:MAG: DUF998 domain-containing protein [Chloroflexota bacterium]
MKLTLRPLLTAGLVGPLLFIVVFLVEGITRPGYSAWRHYVSQLATGNSGWVQVVNFVVCGALVIGFAFGLRQTLRPGRASLAAPILMGLFGSALIVAGVFSTDPALGYPVGALPIHTTHGMVHGLAGLAAFSLLPVTALVMAWRFSADSATRRWAMYSAAIGLLIIGCFIASTAFSVLDERGVLTNAPTGFVQRVAIIGGWTWIAMVALRQLRLGAAIMNP